MKKGDLGLDIHWLQQINHRPQGNAPGFEANFPSGQRMELQLLGSSHDAIRTKTLFSIDLHCERDILKTADKSHNPHNMTRFLIHLVREHF